MTRRSTKALRGAALLAALVLPAVASAQDTSSTRTTRDSAGAHSMHGMQGVRFDTTQALTLTGVTIVRLDSMGGGNGAWNSGARSGMSAGQGASSAMGSPRGAATPSGIATAAGQTVAAIVLSGTDSMQVVLGPSDYLASQQLTLAAGDVISLKGVRVQAGASGMGAGAAMSTVLATEITKNGTTVALRDKSTGTPSWGMSGADAGRNRGDMASPAMTRDSIRSKKDTNITTSPIRKP